MISVYFIISINIISLRIKAYKIIFKALLIVSYFLEMKMKQKNKSKGK